MASFFERRLLNHARCINPAKIRQIIATYGMKYLDEREEKTLARTMLHSTEVHQRYYTKQSGGELFESGRIVLRKIISKETELTNENSGAKKRKNPEEENKRQIGVTRKKFQKNETAPQKKTRKDRTEKTKVISKTIPKKEQR